MLAFVPEEQFALLSGEEALTEYRFNTKLISHLFCKTCGTESFSRGTDKAGKATVMVNIRCLDDVDLSALHPSEYNGKIS